MTAIEARPREECEASRPAAGRWQAWLSTASRLILAMVFAWSGLSKMAGPDAAVRAVRAYQLVPEGLVKLFAWGVPFVELAVAVLLLAGVATRLTAVVASGLLLVFMFSIASAWARGLQIDCGCFGGGGPAQADAAKYLSELARDFGLLVLAGWLVWRPGSHFAIDTD